MRNRVLTTLALTALILSSAHAQTAPVPPPAGAPRADSFSRAPAVDAAKDSAIRKLLDVMGVRANMAVAMEGMIDLYKQRMPSVPPDFWAQFQTAVSGNELIDMMVPIYDRHYSLEEIRALTAFYDSPTGRKFVAEQPVMVKESMAAGAAWGRDVGAKIMKKLQDAGYKPPTG
jgi:hypothetical protein